jgi:hypothetical protein
LWRKSNNLSELSRRDFVAVVEPTILELFVGFIDLALLLAEHMPGFDIGAGAEAVSGLAALAFALGDAVVAGGGRLLALAFTLLGFGVLPHRSRSRSRSQSINPTHRHQLLVV